jgi:WD40 repeat protein
VAFSPDGKRIVSGSGDKTIRVWNANSSEVMLRPFLGEACQ